MQTERRLLFLVTLLGGFCAATTIALPAQTLTTLHSFNGTDGGNPDSSLIQATDGNFYGTTFAGGASDYGTVFKVTPAGTLTTLYSFCSQPNCADGEYPVYSLVQATDGNLYGTTMDGGASGAGTVFRIAPNGELDTLYSFCSQPGCADGNYPASLVQATDGNLYGTTFLGGAGGSNCTMIPGEGCGTVFKITPGGALTTLHSFEGYPTDGSGPAAALVQATDGNFYGTTTSGGAYGTCTSPYGEEGCGTVFKITPGGALTTLHSFEGYPTEGQEPEAALVQASDGNFYGTTSYGGPYGYGYGTVFRITPNGELDTLYSFCSQGGDCVDGAYPDTELVQATDGNFYGTTHGGGASWKGTVFKITPAGTLTTLYTFHEDQSDGIWPDGGLVQATDGNFYGTTWGGGAYDNPNCFGGLGCGTVFSLSLGQPSYILTVSTTGNGTVTSTDGFISCPGTCSHSYPSNTQVTLNAAAATGWTFSGWSGACSGTGPCVVTMTQSLSVGATFTQLSYTLTVSTTGNGTVISADGFISCPGTCSHSYPSNTQVTLNAAAATGWTFSGWSGACSGTGPCVVTMTQSLSVGATFTQLSYTLTVSTTGSGSVTSTDGFISCPGTCSHSYPSNTQVTLNAAAATGWTFSGWSGACSGTGPCVVTMTQSLSVGATFTQLSYTLTVSTTGNGTVISADGFISCPGTCSHSYPSNTQVTLNAAAATGWTFSGWSGACSGTGPCVVTMTQSLSVGATFTQLSYTLTVSTTGSGTVTSTDGFISCPSTCSHLYPSNTQVTLNAAAATGWTFSGWSGACSGTGPCVVTMTQSLSVGATFTQVSYTLTVSTSGSGTVTSDDGFISCPGTCSHSYPVNTRVTLNAAPAAGWFFDGWNGSCFGTGSCIVTMTQSLTVDATFSQALQFVPVTPCRLYDTRTQHGGGGPIQGGTSKDFNLPQLAQSGPCAITGLDLSSAGAYSLNITVVPQGTLGYLTLWPTGEDRSVVSTLNSVDGRVKANAAITPAGTDGQVSVYVTNTTDVVIDIDGYFAPLTTSTLAFYPLTPCRVVDTRKDSFLPDLGPPQLFANTPRSFPVLESTTCIPSGVTPAAYSFNFTVVPINQHPVGYLSVWPSGESQPVVSTLNDQTGTIVANAAIVPAGTNGAVTVFSTDDTQLLIDINGYFAMPTAPMPGLSLYALTPCRALDTRQIYPGQPFSGNLTPPLDVVNGPCGPPSPAQAYVFNATVVPVGSLGYLALWPDGETQPVVSTLNAVDGAITNNMAIVPTNNGSIDAYAGDGLTQLLLDLSSYFAP